MKKRWYSTIAVLIALLVLVSIPVPALAQSGEEATASPEPVNREALAIVAPRRAQVGEEVSMTVFQRRTQDPVKDAAIWALTQEAAESLKQEIASIREAGGTAIQDVDYELLVSARGTFLGFTQGNGQLRHTFNEAGRYLLVALKQGYFPGFAPIAIGTTAKALAIQAPRRVQVGEEVTMTVFQRGTQDPVKDAAIWALTREAAEDLKQEIASIREAGNTAIQDVDYELLVSVRGSFLGFTQGNGQLRHAFNEAGGYLLVALKQGYFPGFAPIAVGTTAKALAIQTLNWAQVGQEVTMTVFQRGTLDPVKDAAIWALTQEAAEDLKQEIASIREAGDTAIQDVDYELLVSVRGTLLGFAQGNGQLRHTFNEAGGYLLVALKQGYFPGFTPISIRATQTTGTLDSQEATEQ